MVIMILCRGDLIKVTDQCVLSRVCVCVCFFVCMYVSLCVHICVCLCVHMSMWFMVCFLKSVCVCVCVCVCVRTPDTQNTLENTFFVHQMKLSFCQEAYHV